MHPNSSLNQRKENARNPVGAQFAIGKKRLVFLSAMQPMLQIEFETGKKCFGVFIFFYITSNKYQSWVGDVVGIKSADDFGLYCEQNR